MKTYYTLTEIKDEMQTLLDKTFKEANKVDFSWSIVFKIVISSISKNIEINNFDVAKKWLEDIIKDLIKSDMPNSGKAKIKVHLFNLINLF